MTEAPVPVLDLKDYRAGKMRSAQFVLDLRKSLQTTGFFYLKNHGVAQESVAAAFAAYPSFFERLPLEVRKKYEHPEVGRQWGYTPMSVEKGEHASVSDHKHFWHYHENNRLEVEEAPEFNIVNEKLFLYFYNTFEVLMGAVALSLGLGKDYFQDQLGNCLLRVIHYPAQEEPQTSNERVEDVTAGGNVTGMCASRHTDINLLTLLLARQAGLQLFHEGKWLPMTISDPNVLIVNCGDMLQHLTGGLFKSGEHRVVCERGVDRYSMPFFGHPVDDFSIAPLTTLGKADKDRFPHRTARQFLNQRLKDIGLMM